MEQIAILTRGLWRLRREVGTLSRIQPVRWDTFPRPPIAAVAGWGHAATAQRARSLATRSGCPYIAFEDGPLRSVRPGPDEPPASLVADRSGIYYDAGRPSDLLRLVSERDWYTPEVASRAAAARDRLRHLRLSKYNSGRDRRPGELGLQARATRRILVLDQVRDDASIRGGLADEASFEAMLAAALADNPGAEIVVKLHPDALSGRRTGYFSALRASDRIRLIAEAVNPWSLLDVADAVYTVSSGLGFEAAATGKPVACFGSPFYSGWGFTDDRRPGARRRGDATVLEMFAAYYLRYARYFDAYSREATTFEAAVEQLAWRRDRFHGQPRRTICIGITRWKRRSVRRMLDGPAGPPLQAGHAASAVRMAKAQGGQVAAWASRDNSRLERACREAGVDFLRVEDGFVRSAGLGASFVLPLSLVFDRRGIYYDSGAPSDLEHLLQNIDFSAELGARAGRLRASLEATGTTKYNVRGGGEPPIAAGGRPVILVPGQVEDDASIEKGSPVVGRNIDLLRAVRERRPDAFIVYKPHPDVEAGFRGGRVPEKAARGLADQIASRASILSLIAACDRVETMTSLAGFEALLRGRPVTTHGQPFYAGWGLTEDLCPPARRTRRLSLDELVAGALILYPSYLDPESGLPCEPELLVERLARAGSRRLTPGERLARAGQAAAARLLHVSRSLQRRARGSG